MFKNETLAKKIKERQELKDQMDVLEFKVNAINEELKKDMTERGQESYEFEFDGEKHKISYKVFDQERFDAKKFAEDHPELYKKYLKVSPSSRLNVK